MTLRSDELQAMEKLTDAINACLALPESHGSERAEMVHHFHAVQALIMARSAIRCHPGMFRVKARLSDGGRRPWLN